MRLQKQQRLEVCKAKRDVQLSTFIDTVLKRLKQVETHVGFSLFRTVHFGKWFLIIAALCFKNYWTVTCYQAIENLTRQLNSTFFFFFCLFCSCQVSVVIATRNISKKNFKEAQKSPWPRLVTLLPVTSGNRAKPQIGPVTTPTG